MAKRSNLVFTEVFNNYTPDTPSLRYGGPIPLLLYGNSAKHDVFHTFLTSFSLQNYKDFSSRNPAVVTKEGFVGVTSYGMHRPLPYSSYLIDATNFNGLTARPVRGRLLTVSLHGLSLLDRYFMNEIRCLRKVVPIEPVYSGYSWAFTYIFNPGSLSKPEYEFKGMPIVKYNDQEIYTYG